MSVGSNYVSNTSRLCCSCKVPTLVWVEGIISCCCICIRIEVCITSWNSNFVSTYSIFNSSCFTISSVITRNTTRPSINARWTINVSKVTWFCIVFFDRIPDKISWSKVNRWVFCVYTTNCSAWSTSTKTIWSSIKTSGTKRYKQFVTLGSWFFVLNC